MSYTISIFIRTSLITTLLLVHTGRAEEPPMAPVYLLAGQSNMQGVGKLAELTTEQQKADPSTRFWNGKVFEPWVPGQTRSSTRAGEFGPELGMVPALRVAHPDRVLYVVKFHRSGQPLHHGWHFNTWKGGDSAPGRANFYPGEYPGDPKQGKHYKDLIQTARAAYKALEARGLQPVLQGVVWMQGEQDSKHEVSALAYDASLVRLKARLEEDLDSAPRPFVFGQVLPHEPALPRFTQRKELRSRMADAVRRSVETGIPAGLRMVPTEGMPLNKDTVHFNARGQWLLGQAMGKSMVEAEKDFPNALVTQAAQILEAAPSRLLDYSYTGYRSGDQPLPQPAVSASVCDYGARGDDDADDTRAFQKAVAEAPPGAIFIPAGRYILTDVITIRRSGVVLRGAGPGKTLLDCPKSLEEIKSNMGQTTSGRPTSNYSWSGGMIQIRGGTQRQPSIQVQGKASMGVRSLLLQQGKALPKWKAGDELEITQRDDGKKSLVHHLYAGDPGDIRKYSGARVSQVLQVKGLHPDGRLELDRPLRWDLRPEWQPRVSRYEPSVVDSGIEELSFHFPEQPYRGHFTERGHNAVALSGTTHCWVRNVDVLNADSGMFISGKFNTVEGVSLRSARSPHRGCTGHHGFILTGEGNLLTGFRIDTRFIHDLTVSSRSEANVFSSGSGVDLSFDHHRRAPYANLYTDLDAGAGTRLWYCGGGASLGKHCAAYATFWNIRSRRAIPLPPTGFGPPRMNLVGLRMDGPAQTDAKGLWVEPLAEGETLTPKNLHRAQWARRLKE